MDSTEMRRLRDQKYDDATRIAWSFRSGPKRKKSKLLNSGQAITEAHVVFDRLRGRLLTAGLSDEDTEVWVFFADPNFQAVVDQFRFHRRQSTTEELEKRRSHVGRNLVCLGLVGLVWSEKLRDVVVFERPFLTEPNRALLLLSDAAERLKAR